MTGAFADPIAGPKHLQMRLVTPDDAGYIHSLRTDPAYNAHLSTVSGDVDAQRAWIERYKTDEAAGTQYYFVILTRAGQRCGLVRLYDITPETFTWGSWILDQSKPPKAALESAVMIYDIAFDTLGLNRAVFEVLRENAHTMAFHQRFGARQTSEDETSFYFAYSSEQFRNDRPAFLSALTQP